MLDFEIPLLGIKLRGGADLMTRRPYPNKRYAVACCKQGRWAVDGILIETTTPVKDFLTAARWTVADQALVTHHVHYRILDEEFDTASENAVFWYAWPGWSSRWPEWARNLPPCDIEPAMEVLPRAKLYPEALDLLDEVDGRSGWIVRRCQTFGMPTMERERILQGGGKDSFQKPIDLGLKSQNESGNVALTCAKEGFRNKRKLCLAILRQTVHRVTLILLGGFGLGSRA